MLYPSLLIEYATPETTRETRDEMDKLLMKGGLKTVYVQEKRKTPHEIMERVQ